jgi:hypothetical protein
MNNPEKIWLMTTPVSAKNTMIPVVCIKEIRPMVAPPPHKVAAMAAKKIGSGILRPATA